ncbi:hypothetical protein LTR17_008078 [Elasticomyces elasticus]|nr:hypothetical protein LTR17_008078 [Elasticomyces elasticus]
MAYSLKIAAVIGCLTSTISAAPQSDTPTLVRRSCKNLYEQTASVSVFISRASSTKADNSQFEDVPKETGIGALLGLPGNPFRPISTPYKYLSWQGFTYGQDLEIPVIGQSLLPGLNLDTPEFFAATGVVGQVLGGKPRLTAVYPDSKVSEWTLKSFAYACVVNEENGATDAATPCTVNLKGYYVDSKGVTTKKCDMDFDYNPSAGLGRKDMANTAKTGLDLAHCFQDVSYIDFEYVAKTPGATVNSPLIALAVDTVQFTPYDCHAS